MKEAEIEATIKIINTQDKQARRFFKLAYNYEDFNKDYLDWREYWNNLNHEQKRYIISKGTRNGAWNKVVTTLQSANGNPFKAYKMLKQMKEDELKEDSEQN